MLHQMTLTLNPVSFRAIFVIHVLEAAKRESQIKNFNLLAPELFFQF